jgi:ABC-type amino acid transport substrate-binding protein
VEEKAAAYGGVLVPLAYSIPSLGVFVVLLFVLFAAWYYNDLFTLQEQATLALVGVPSLFGSAKLSLPFILQMMRLPADAMQLYLIASPLLIYFTSALSCMSIFALSAIGTAYLTGVGKLRARRALYSAGVGVVALVSVVLVLNAAFGAVLATAPPGDASVLGMKMPSGAGGARVGEQFATTVDVDYADVPAQTQPSGAENATLLDRIESRGALRVGYIPDLMPFSYFNREGELVGHDVQMAYDLAEVLNVSRVEFVPVDRENALDRVNAGDCDIVMAGLVLVSPMVGKARFTSPYIDLHLALVTLDDRKSAFEDLEAVKGMEGLRIAVAGDADYDRAAAAIFPRATIVPLDDPEEFFNRTDADALLTTAETGTPLTRLHPFYALAAVQSSGASVASSVYVLARNCDDASLMLVDYWLAMEERSGDLKAKYDYWVLGKEMEQRAPRWSVIRDVLHWVA